MSNKIRVERVRDISSDTGICDAARVSFKKLSSAFTEAQNKGLIRYLFTHRHWSPFGQARLQLSLRDFSQRDILHFFMEANLAGFRLVEHAGYDDRYEVNGSVWAWIENLQHFPPEYRPGILYEVSRLYPWTFELLGEKNSLLESSWMAFPSNYEHPKLLHLTFRGEAPIYVVRQLGKHQVGLTWNEVSRRYVDEDPEHFDIVEWRARPEGSIKQGSGSVITDPDLICLLNGVVDHCRDVTDNGYRTLKQYVAPEQARSVLMQDMQTEWIWTGSILDFARICKERLHPSAQKESRMFAEQLAGLINAEDPSLWGELMGA